MGKTIRPVARLTLLLAIIATGVLWAQNPEIVIGVGSGGGSGGGVTTPAGSDGDAQCNDGGAFGVCPPGSYPATMSSNTTWTITGATHGLETCDLTANTWTVSGGIRTWAVGSGMECDEDDYDVRITWASATAGRVVLIKGGGGGGGGGGAPTDAKYWLAAADATLSAEKNLGALADNAIVAVDVAGSEATPRAAVYTDIVPLFNSGTCSGYLKSDGTCDTPSGSFPAATAYQLYRRNSDDTADEAATLTAGTGVTITPSSGQVTVSTDCAQVACLGLNNAPLGDWTYAGRQIQTPSATQTLVAGDAITVSTITFKSISAASGITLTSAPTIADGSDGQELILTNVGGTNSIVIQDEANLAGTNLCLPGDTNITIAAREAVRMVFSSTAGCWIAFK
jgi:hypothetical protein